MSEVSLYQLQNEWREAVESLPAEELSHPGWLIALEPKAAWRPTALYAELEDVRAQWAEIRALPQTAERAGKLINRAWTLKDLMAHLLSWAEEFGRQVDMVAHNKGFDYVICFSTTEPGPPEWNKREVEARREMSLDEILEAFDAASRCLQDLVFEVSRETLLKRAAFPVSMTGDPDAPMQASIAQVVSMKCRHDRHHLRQIQRFLA